MASNPTLDPQGGVNFSGDPKVIGKEQDIVNALTAYWNEADNARKGGLNPRDAKWSENLDLYWNRYNFADKAGWQAKETMPEVPSYVDRFAAAMKEALIAAPGGFYAVTDPADQEKDLTTAVKKITDVWLSVSGRNQVGQLLSFPAVFEEQMKLGALTATSSVVTWKNDIADGRVAIETVDPRMVWLDPTYRNLYRIRRTEVDKHELSRMLSQVDGKGKPLFNLDEMAKLVGSFRENEQEKRELAGHGVEVQTARQPVTLDEYIATVVGPDGELLADRSLIVLANGRYLVRGPEKNPFWHGKDWLAFAPLVTTPLSVYGRSYMEDFGSVAKTFTEMTNMILDAVHVSSLKAFAVVPEMLINPNQVTEGLSPNKLFLLEGGNKASDFAHALDLGTLPKEAVTVWEAMKRELSEAAGLNEVGLGQFAPNSRTSATEIMETQSSSSALVRSVAQTVETRYLDVVLDLTWKTGMQHVSRNDKMIRAAAGDDMFEALYSNRKELISRPITFQARGISTIIERSKMLKTLLTLLSIIASNEGLLKAFLEKVDLNKLLARLFELSNIDLTSLQLSEREKMIRSVTEPMGSLMGGQTGSPSINAQQEMGDVARAMGVGK